MSPMACRGLLTNTGPDETFYIPINYLAFFPFNLCTLRNPPRTCLQPLLYNRRDMTTPTQIASNRQNSTLSTGPRSESGKIASSKNAISHGLSSADPVLAYENRAEFDKLVATYSLEFEPQNHHQTFLVSQMADARWRLSRVQRIENAALDLILAAPGELPETPDHKIAQRMLDSGGDPLPRLERYRASIERSYHRAVKEFRMAQKQQIQNEANSRRARGRQMEDFIHAAANAPIPGYKGVEMQLDEPRTRLRATQNSAMRP